MTSARSWLLAGARVAFVVAVIAFAWWSFRNDWGAIGVAIAALPPLAVVGSLLLTGVGIVALLPLWMALVRGFGHRVPLVNAAQILFVGQLGKYIPGSVWSVAAQAQMSRRFGIPVRSSVAIGLMTIGCSLLGALGAAGIAGMLGAFPFPLPLWLYAIVVALTLAGLSPPVLTWIATLVGRPTLPVRVTLSGSLVIVLSLAVTWASWTGAAALILNVSEPTDTTGSVVALWGALALSYAAGLVVVIAPAGIGVREGILVALLSAVVAIPTAVAVVLVTRILNAVMDFLIAGIAQVISTYSDRYRVRAQPTVAPPASAD